MENRMDLDEIWKPRARVALDSARLDGCIVSAEIGRGAEALESGDEFYYFSEKIFLLNILKHLCIEMRESETHDIASSDVRQVARPDAGDAGAQRKFSLILKKLAQYCSAPEKRKICAIAGSESRWVARGSFAARCVELERDEVAQDPATWKFLLKCSRGGTSTLRAEFEMINEAVVGLLGTNALREIIPNFMYIYGVYEAPGTCDRNSTRLATTVATCARWNPTVAVFYSNFRASYVMVENIYKSVTLDRWIRRERKKQNFWSRLCKLIYQVVLALSVARDACDFVHNDLHAGNILVTELQQTTNIEYPLRDGRVARLEVNAIAHIIDFGMSHITAPISRAIAERIALWEKSSHGTPSEKRISTLIDFENLKVRTGTICEKIGVSPSSANSLHDIARFASSCLICMKDEKRERNKIKSWLLSPFFGDIPTDICLEVWTTKYSKTPPGLDIDLLEYFYRIQKTQPPSCEDIIKVEKARIPGNAKDDALEKETILEKKETC